MKRRSFLTFLALLSPATWSMSLKSIFNSGKKQMIKKIQPIDFQWPMQEPFLFCAHHNDEYPAGNSNHGLDSSHFAGRNMGSDFQVKDGFRLYHGKEVPGFPVHPHRGFETITIVRKGYVDHADSLGAAGRYGDGDVQWMTAGSGVQHSEMFPLLHKDKENTLELFQLWLNLPKKNKMVPADFKMLWSGDIPRINENGTDVTLISGSYNGKEYYQAPKNSWAAEKENGVNILLVKMKQGASFEMPATSIETNRSLYLFEGEGFEIDDKVIVSKNAVYLHADQSLNIKAKGELEFLFLEAKPIGEPIVQHGPFVMNTREEIAQTINDYHQTQFGGWSWDRNDMIHGEKIERFAKYPDGRVVRPS